MSYNNLNGYYRLLWSLTHQHGYSVSEIEEMAPFEREIIIELIAEHERKKQEAMYHQEEYYG